MGINEEHGLEVRVIEEATKRGIIEYRLALTNPSELGFTWFEKKDKEKVVKKQKAEALWEEYNPILKERIRQFSQFIKEGAFLKEITDILEIDYTTARSWKETTARYCNVKYLLKRKGPRQRGPWHSIPIELVSYMLYYYMPQIEGWKIPYDVAKENDVSKSTIVNMCKEPGIEVIERKKIFISPLGEQVIAERLGQKKVKQYVIRLEGKDYYSIAYAGREATVQNGFEEETKAFEIEAGTRYKRMLWVVKHCLAVKHEDIKGSPYVDRENLRLLLDIITVEEASQIGSLSKKEIRVMMEEDMLPALPSGKTDFTLRSAILNLKGAQEGKKEEAGTELKTKLDAYENGKLRQVESSKEITDLREEIPRLTKEREVHSRAYKQRELELKTYIGRLEAETNKLNEAMERLRKRYQDTKTTINQYKQRINELEIIAADYEKLKSNQEKLSEEIADLIKQRTDAQKYDRQLQELTDQLTAAKSTIRKKQKVLEEQGRMITEWRKRYSAETRDYFSNLAAQASIIEEALSKGEPPEETPIADLRSYLIRAKQFQPRTIQPNSDYSPAMVAQSITTFPVSDVWIWYGKWCKSKEQRFVANLTQYFSALANELEERYKKIIISFH